MMPPETYILPDTGATNLGIQVQSCRRYTSGYWTIVGLVSGTVQLPDGRELVVNREVHIGQVGQRGRTPYGTKPKGGKG